MLSNFAYYAQIATLLSAVLPSEILALTPPSSNPDSHFFDFDLNSLQQSYTRTQHHNPVSLPIYRKRALQHTNFGDSQSWLSTWALREKARIKAKYNTIDPQEQPELEPLKKRQNYHKTLTNVPTPTQTAGAVNLTNYLADLYVLHLESLHILRGFNLRREYFVSVLAIQREAVHAIPQAPIQIGTPPQQFNVILDTGFVTPISIHS